MNCAAPLRALAHGQHTVTPPGTSAGRGGLAACELRASSRGLCSCAGAWHS